ncbi:hypothetical protein GCM10008014_54010 [Paenibacillus silvae]|uniref:PQQ-binding-like beta-propeller repeat protein n=1 Tax=Paenibacillus silvae TaxID=1325358 RepID=A0ABQ1ZNJ0_9BACL|nr:hypothetical protein [Paenibacillus silvae]GGH70013.1 hypothetical protein GCM10008014_54010 [Paenibacillus silvae]
MKLKQFNYWLIASLCFFLASPSEPALAKDLMQFQWGYDITNGGQSRTSSHLIESVTDAMGNQSLIVTKEGYNDAYIDILDAKTGALLWSIPIFNRGYVLSDDGYMFIFDEKKVSARHVYSGQVIWTAPLPKLPLKFSYYYWPELAFPRENGSLYLALDSEEKSTLYHYNSKGKISQKFKLPYLIEQIKGDVIISKKYSDHPDVHINSLSTGKKIKTIVGTKGYNQFIALSDGTLMQYNLQENTMILKAYNSAGQIKWTKQLPYNTRFDSSSAIVALKDRFLFVDAKNKRIKLYTSAGKLIAESAYLPLRNNYNGYWEPLNVAIDGTSFMFLTSKNGNDELVIMDTSNLNVLSSYKKSEFDLDKEFLFLNNTTGLYIISDEGRNLVSMQLSK